MEQNGCVIDFDEPLNKKKKRERWFCHECGSYVSCKYTNHRKLCRPIIQSLLLLPNLDDDQLYTLHTTELQNIKFINSKILQDIQNAIFSDLHHTKSPLDFTTCTPVIDDCIAHYFFKYVTTNPKYRNIPTSNVINLKLFTDDDVTELTPEMKCTQFTNFGFISISPNSRNIYTINFAAYKQTPYKYFKNCITRKYEAILKHRTNTSYITNNKTDYTIAKLMTNELLLDIYNVIDQLTELDIYELCEYIVSVVYEAMRIVITNTGSIIPSQYHFIKQVQQLLLMM